MIKKRPVLGIYMSERLFNEWQKKATKNLNIYLRLMGVHMQEGMEYKEASFQACKDMFGHYPI